MMIGQGAEAIVTKTDATTVLKERIVKDYRHPVIDNALRKARTRREAKIFGKLAVMDFPAPRLKLMDDVNMRLTMDFINGPKLRDVFPTDNVRFSKELGRKVGVLHANDIVHGDLTTSNMILDNEIKFIDFGLSLISKKAEDKAVDLHLLDRALESKHHEVYSGSMLHVLEGYKEGNPAWQDVFNRLEKVQKRGRNKK
ncbi:Kae1-associated serine/threonine protein kinase [Candidatus Woesearchaeota archaeon]|nr:Kae1-associated serine/threonine protein kinase [Candidatus Woesearchaeota archaeon]